MPLVRRRVEEFFGQRPLTDINPDEVVAIGAAIHAYSLTSEELPADVVMKRRPKAADDDAIAPITVRAQQLQPESLARQAAHKPAPLPPGFAAVTDAGAKSAQRTLMGLPKVAAPPASIEDADEPFGELEPPRIEPLEPPAFDALGPPEIDELDDDLLESLRDDRAPVEPPPMAKPGGLPPPRAPEPLHGDSMPAALFGSMPAAQEPPPLAPPRPLDTVAGEGQTRTPAEDEDRRSYAVPTNKGAVSTLLLDVTPRALGVATAGGYCDQIIARNAPIPIEQSRLFSTSTENQTEVLIDVYQGESRRVSENAKLGNVVLGGLRPTTRGEIKIRVTFEIDTDGILRVSARNEETGAAQQTKIQLSGGLSDDQVNDLVARYATDKR
jgi:molecular chaperone DnaK